MAVDDRLGQPGGARREEHVERVVEGDGLELERAGLGQQVVPRDGVGELVARRRGRARRARASAGRRGSSATCVAAVDRPVAVGVAVDGEQDLGLDLAEARQHAARAELGRARRPRRPEAGGGQEGDERLGDVGQVGDDAVARPDAQAPQAGARPRDLLAQLAEGQLDRLARLRARDDRHPVGVLVGAQQRARRSSAARRGTTRRRASRARRARARRARARARRRSPRPTPQKPSRSSTDQRHSAS